MRKILFIWILFFTMFATVIHADITTGLEAHYEFEGNVNDSTVNELNATASTTPRYASGKMGQAIEFINDYTLATPLDELTYFNGSWTKALWVKLNSVQSGDGNLLSSSNYAMWMPISTHKLESYPFGITGTTNLNDTQWHHLAITYDNTSQLMQVIVDGVVENNGTITKPTLSSSNFLGINQHGTGGVNGIVGLMDDARIYNRALTSIDIAELYNYTPPILTLKAHGGALQISNSVLDTSGFSAETNQTVTNFTVEWWMNPSAHFSTGNTIGYGWGSFLFHEAGSGDLYVGINGDSALNRLTPTDGLGAGTLELNKWQHFAFSFDASNGTGTLYKNGLSLASKSGMSSPSIFGDFAAGKAYTSVLSQQFMLDDVRVWNITRTGAQIKASMNYQLDGNETGLVAYYNFDERVGTTVKDRTAHGYDGSIDTSKVTRLNFLGDGLSFSGTNSGVQTTASLNCSTYPNFSLGAWIKPISSQTGWHAIFTQSNSLGVDLENGTLGNATLAINQWSYVARSQEGSTVRYYVNGNLALEAGSQSCSGNNDPIFIGTHSDLSGSFDGDIAEASIWTKALTQSEILKTMSSPILSDTALVGYWPFNEGAGTTAFDKSASANNGTIVNATWTDTAPTLYGNYIYTLSGIPILNKLVVENNTSTPTYSYNGNVPSTIADFNGTTGVFTYYSQIEATETLDINASDGGVSLQSLFHVISYAGPIDLTLNITNVSLLEHNITNIQIIAQDGTSESLLIPDIASGNISDGNNTYTVPIYHPDNNFSIRVDLNDSTQWWVNFNDGKLYKTNNASSDFKTLIGSATNTLSVDFINANFISAAPTLSHIYDRFRTPSSAQSDFSISFDVNDSDTATLTLTVSADNNNTLNTANFSVNSSITANQTQSINIIPVSATSVGDTKVTITLNDGTTTTQQSFNVNISHEFEIITTKEANISGIDFNLDYNGTLYALSSHQEENNLTVEYEKLKVVNSLFDSNLTVIKDVNGTATVTTKTSTMPTPFQYANSNLGSADLSGAYSNYGTPFEFTFIDETSTGTKVYVTYPVERLEIDANNMRDQNGSFFTSINSFMGATVQGSATQGIRNHARNKLLVFNQNEVANSSGILIELDENGTVLTANAGTWIKQTVSSQEVLLINPTAAVVTASGYDTDMAFVLDNGIVKSATYKASGDIYSYILLDKAAKDALYHSISPNPKIATPLNNGYTYISLPSSKTLCDVDVQMDGNYSFCDKNNTLESVFGANSHVERVFKFGREWMYWDNNSTANPAYSMQKLSTINPLEGIMVKTSAATSISVPFDEDSESVNDYTNLFATGWTLMSNNKAQTAGEISTALTAEGKVLVYILVLRDNTWHVYAPTNNSTVSSSIPRLSSVNRYESYWVNFR
ncbi:MAG: LamG domain-containing protein [Sulfurimonas sp.]|nr:LamG domain-containing protein [Sulfurimonas sp.]